MAGRMRRVRETSSYSPQYAERPRCQRHAGKLGVATALGLLARAAELDSARDARSDVISLFRRRGFEFEPRLTVKVADERWKPAEGVGCCTATDR